MRSRFLFSVVALFAFAVPGYAYRMSAWVPSWDPNAVAVMQMQAGNLEETNPGWYTVAADGSVTRNYKAEDPTMRAALSGTMLVPTIKNYINGRWETGVTTGTSENPSDLASPVGRITALNEIVRGRTPRRAPARSRCTRSARRPTASPATGSGGRW